MALSTIEREYTIRGVAPAAVYAIATDYACYPRMFPEFSSCRVVQEEGTRKRVEFRAQVVVEVRYEVDIIHDVANLTTSWTFANGDIVSDSEGGWAFSAEQDGTHIRYRAGMAIKAPLPKFVINKISNALMGSSIPNMFRALEHEVLARAKFSG